MECVDVYSIWSDSVRDKIMLLLKCFLANCVWKCEMVFFLLCHRGEFRDLKGNWIFVEQTKPALACMDTSLIGTSPLCCGHGKRRVVWHAWQHFWVLKKSRVITLGKLLLIQAALFLHRVVIIWKISCLILDVKRISCHSVLAVYSYHAWKLVFPLPSPVNPSTCLLGSWKVLKVVQYSFFRTIPVFPNSDGCEIFTRYLSYIEVCYDVSLKIIDISMATINRKPLNQLTLNFTRIRFEGKKVIPLFKTLLYCKSNIQEQKYCVCLISDKSKKHFKTVVVEW